MKISGPKGPGPIPPPEPKVGEAPPGQVPSFREVLGAGRTEQAPPTNPVDKVTAGLRSGEITAPEAVESLIEAVVRQQLGQASSAVKEGLRAALRRMLEEDPMLADKMKLLRPDGGDES